MKKRSFISIFGMVLGSVFVIIVGYIIGDNYTEIGFRVKCVWLLCVYAYCVWYWLKNTHRVCSLFFFFLLYSIMTNAGQLLLNALNIEFFSTVTVINGDYELLSKTVDYQIIGTLFMSVGALFSWSKNHIESVQLRQDSDSDKLKEFVVNGKYQISYTDVLFIIISFVQIAMSISSLASRASMSYIEAFYSDTTSSFSLIIKFAFYISLFSACVRHCRQKDAFRKVIFLVVALYALAEVLYGSRNVLIPLVFGLLYLFREDLKRIKTGKRILIVILAIVAMLFLSAFATIRNQSLSSLSITDVIQSVFGNGILTPLISLVAEMGGSTRVLSYTIQAIDSGSVASENTLLYTLAKGIFSTDFLSIIGVNEPTHWRLSSWITKANGSYGGWGYSMMAESYFNFGSWGCLFLSIWGYFYVWFECHIEKWFLKGYRVQASAWLYVVAYAIFLARAETSLITLSIRYALYITIVCYVMRKARLKI